MGGLPYLRSEVDHSEPHRGSSEIKKTSNNFLYVIVKSIVKKLWLTCAPPLLATTRFRSLLAFTTEAVTASGSAVATDMM